MTVKCRSLQHSSTIWFMFLKICSNLTATVSIWRALHNRMLQNGNRKVNTHWTGVLMCVSIVSWDQRHKWPHRVQQWLVVGKCHTQSSWCSVLQSFSVVWNLQRMQFELKQAKLLRKRNDDLITEQNNCYSTACAKFEVKTLSDLCKSLRPLQFCLRPHVTQARNSSRWNSQC